MRIQWNGVCLLLLITLSGWLMIEALEWLYTYIIFYVLL